MKRLAACLLGLVTLCAAGPAQGSDGVSIGRASTGVPEATLEDPSGRLEELSEIRRTKKKTADKKHTARMKVLGDTARTLGFQEGFRWQYQQLMAEAEKREERFAKIFDFRRLLIDGKVLPPVIRWSGPAMKLESDSYATEVEAQYRIVAPAKIVSTPPSWRDYIEVEAEVLRPADEILPATSAEADVWKEMIHEGWGEGVEHARMVFEMSMTRLVSDFRGILRFKMLADKGLVSVPVLAQGDLGVQVGDNVLNVDQKTFRITVPAEFKRLEN